MALHADVSAVPSYRTITKSLPRRIGPEFPLSFLFALTLPFPLAEILMRLFRRFDHARRPVSFPGILIVLVALIRVVVVPVSVLAAGRAVVAAVLATVAITVAITAAIFTAAAVVLFFFGAR